MNTKTTAVIGGGIIGIACALWLQRGGHKVIVIDPTNRVLVPATAMLAVSTGHQ